MQAQGKEDQGGMSWALRRNRCDGYSEVQGKIQEDRGVLQVSIRVSTRFRLSGYSKLTAFQPGVLL